MRSLAALRAAIALRQNNSSTFRRRVADRIGMLNWACVSKTCSAHSNAVASLDMEINWIDTVRLHEGLLLRLPLHSPEPRLPV
jgi:hypothetical protein